MVPDLLTLDLPRNAYSPRLARAAVGGLEEMVGAERLSDLRLLTSELVSNAVKYGGAGDVRLRVMNEGERLRVEVIDQGTGFHAQETADARDRDDLETVGGWGLPIVQTLASDWGSFEGSTHVWFEFDLAPESRD